MIIVSFFVVTIRVVHGDRLVSMRRDCRCIPVPYGVVGGRGDFLVR